MWHDHSMPSRVRRHTGWVSRLGADLILTRDSAEFPRRRGGSMRHEEHRSDVVPAAGREDPRDAA